MGGIGIIHNPRSHRNRRAPDTGRRLRALLDGEGEVVDASTQEELQVAVERFQSHRVEVLGVNGGDGTAHVVLTAFARAYGTDPLPAVALLRGGAMNTVADAHELRGRPEAILRGLLERRRAGATLRTVERDLLSVQADGAPPQLGFLFGTGAVVSQRAYYATGHACARHGGGVAGVAPSPRRWSGAACRGAHRPGDAARHERRRGVAGRAFPGGAGGGGAGARLRVHALRAL